MKRLKRILVSGLATTLILSSPQSNADMFGGDVVVLTQILAQAIQQLIQLKQILSTGTNTLDLLRDINQGIRDEAAFKFFSALPELYADLAMLQFYCAGRIGETAGIQLSNLYLEEEYFMIKDSISWCNKSKMFEYLKPYPKNKEPRRVHIHQLLREIIERRLKDRYPGCNFLFHVRGQPLNYCTIQANYRLAQQKTGIPYRGTHCLRHGMATLARRVGGMGLDSVVAMTGHKDLKLADHYSKIDGEVQKETSLKIVEHIRKLGLDKDSELYTGNVVPLKRIK